MGQYISCDSSPLNVTDFVNNATKSSFNSSPLNQPVNSNKFYRNTIRNNKIEIGRNRQGDNTDKNNCGVNETNDSSNSNSLHNPHHNSQNYASSTNQVLHRFRHNIKIFCVENDSQSVRPVVFNSDFKMQSDACYIFIHLYRLSQNQRDANDEINDEFDTKDLEDSMEPLRSWNHESITFVDSSQRKEERGLVHSCIKQSRESDNDESNESTSGMKRFSQNSIFQVIYEQFTEKMQPQSLTHPFSLPSKYHTIHLYNGCHSNSQTQAFAISQSLHLERVFMDLKEENIDKLMRNGNSVSICSPELKWHFDIPVLSKVPKFQAGYYMHLYNSCDLFRVLINDCTNCVDQIDCIKTSEGSEINTMWLEGLSMHRLLQLPSPKHTARRVASSKYANSAGIEDLPPLNFHSLRHDEDSLPARVTLDSTFRSPKGSLSARLMRQNSNLVLNEMPLSERSSNGPQSGRSQLTSVSYEYTDDDFSSTFSTPRSTVSSPAKRKTHIRKIRRRSDAFEVEDYASKSARSSISDSSPRSSRSSTSNKTPREFIPKLGRFSLDLDGVNEYSNLYDSPRSISSDQDGLLDPSISGAELVMYFRKRLSNVYGGSLFVGSDWVAKNKEQLQKVGVTHIVNAAKLACGVYFPQDFQYLTLSLYDAGTESIMGSFFDVIEFIENALENGGKVLVHCYEGVSRSTTLAIAYIMWKTRLGFNETMEEVKRKRGSASPNAGFIVQLLQWEKILKESDSVYLYRISPLNDLYYEHRQLIPYLCNVNVLDSRTCFVLDDGKSNNIFVWEGQQSTKHILDTARKFANQLRQYLGNEKSIIEEFHENESDMHPQFLRAIKNIKSFSTNRRSTSDEVYPELGYLDTDRESNSKVEDPEAQMHDLDSSVDNSAAAILYEYPSWECIENFDSDDLYDDAVYVLKPLDRSSTLFVWIGSAVRCDEPIETFGKSIADSFMKKEGSEYPHVVVVEDGNEEGTGIWDYFCF